jgi:outer membrane receptor protein involved in Fe transport
VGLDAAELAQIEPVVGPVSVFNDEEELINYEVGLRHSALNNQLNLALVAYWMEWTNMKTRVGVPYIDTASGTPRVIGLQTNAGNSELQGIEFEGRYAFSDRLTSSFSLNLAQSEYTEFTCSFAHYIPGNASGRVPCEGNTLPKYPEMSGAFSLRWEDQLPSSDVWSYYAQLSGTYFGKAFIEETNYSYYGENWRLDLRAGVRRDDVRLEAFVTNLLDEDTPESAARSADFSQSSFASFGNNYGIVLTPPDQRTFGIRTSVDF